MKVIIDTNAILYSVKRKIDLFEAIKIKYGHVPVIIPNLVLAELKALTKKAKSGADKDIAKLAIEILKTKKFSEIKLKKEYADDAILRYAKDKDVVIITHDTQFQERLKQEKIKYTFLTNKKKLN